MDGVQFAVQIQKATSREVLEMLADEIGVPHPSHHLRTDRLTPDRGVYATFDRTRLVDDLVRPPLMTVASIIDGTDTHFVTITSRAAALVADGMAIEKVRQDWVRAFGVQAAPYQFVV